MAQPVQAKRSGDVFVKWALQNRSNPSRCDTVDPVEHENRKYETFPDDFRLANFDSSDRKFVAISVAHPMKPKILQGTDSKWLAWSLNPPTKDIKRFHKKKAHEQCLIRCLTICLPPTPLP